MVARPGCPHQPIANPNHLLPACACACAVWGCVAVNRFVQRVSVSERDWRVARFPATDRSGCTQRLMADGHGTFGGMHVRPSGGAWHCLRDFSHRALKVNLIYLLTFQDWYWLSNVIFSKPKDFCTPCNDAHHRLLHRRGGKLLFHGGGHMAIGRSAGRPNCTCEWRGVLVSQNVWQLGWTLCRF